MSAQQDAALRGASLAFQNQKPKLPPGDSNTPSTPKNNGALLAATSASRDHSVSRDTSPPRMSRTNSTRPSAQRTISRQTTGGSSVQDWGAKSPDQAAAAAQRLSQFLSSPSSATANSPYLLPPGGRPSADTRSASFIAATLAASRSASPSPNHTGTPGYNAGHNRQASYWETRRGSIGASSVASTASLDLPDTSNIAPTTSLISMFEDKKGDDKPSKKKDASPGRGLGPTPKLRPPTPERELSPKRGEDIKPEPKKTAPKPKPKPKAKPRAVTPPPQIIRRAATEIVSPEPRRIEQRLKLPPPSPPPTRNTPVSQRPRQDKPAEIKAKPAAKAAPEVKSSKPRVTPLVISGAVPTRPRQESTTSSGPRPTTAKSASSDDTFVSASSMQSPRSPSICSLQDIPLSRTDRSVVKPPLKPKSIGRPSTPRAASRPTTPKPRRPQSARMLSNPSPTRSIFQQQPPDTSALTLDSLTSAIVAGNLASAKHPSNQLSRTPPPIPAPRHRHKKISPHHSGRQGMRQTLRQPASKSDDEDARRRKRALEGRKKHTHHEGTRRRWRDEIYEREKKRYEAVWASNRGLFLVNHPSHPSHFQIIELPPTVLREGEDLSEHVANVVVKDIWSRSRLPEDELAEVWDLVDRGRKGMLNKQEFVVGMWLIDQRLRGRKIPARVSSSVWDSVKGVRVPGPGVKVKGK